MINTKEPIVVLPKTEELHKILCAADVDGMISSENLAKVRCAFHFLGVDFANSSDSDKTISAIVENNAITDTKEIKTPSKEEILQNIRKITDEFHKIWYPLQGTVSWMGVDIMKNPMDLLIYSEIIYENRPDLIIECGTFKGGSALFLANLCELNHHGRVLSIDIMQNPTLPLHPRIDYAIGSSVDENIVKMVHSLASSVKKVMVILDSDHTKQHVLDEMNIYSNFVTRGQYLIVEDSNIHGNPVRDDLPEGPFESIQEFFEDEENKRNFLIDKMCERFLFTFNPNGYLRRLR